MAPTLLAGAIGNACGLADDLERAGHTVRPLDLADPGLIAHVDLVLIDVASPAEVRSIAARLAPYARPRQMFLHTALLGGAQLLDDVETARAIVMCAYRLHDRTWLTSAADELGEGVVAMLVAESGGAAVPIADSARPRISAAQELRAAQRTLLIDAHQLLTSAIPNLPALGDEPAGEGPGLDPATADLLLDAIDDPGVRRAFVDMQRRGAEQARDAAMQVWAMDKYEGRNQ